MTSPTTPEQLRRFLDDELSDAERQALEAALSEDEAARRRLVEEFRGAAAKQQHQVPPALKEEMVALADAGSGRGSQPSWVRMALAAAVAVAALGLGVFMLQTGSDPERAVGRGLRDGPGSETARPASPALVAPPADARLEPGRVEFQWTEISAAEEYTLFVLDRSGDIRLKRQTSTPGLTVELSAERPNGPEALYWYVEARLPNADPLASEVRKLTLAGTPVVE